MASLDYLSIGCNRVSQATDCDSDGLVAYAANRLIALYRPQEWTCSAILSGHTAGVSCLGTSSGREIPGDTDLIASAASDGTIRIWERRENEEGIEDTVNCIQVLSIGAKYPLCLALGFLPGLSVPVLISGGTDNKLTVFTSSDAKFAKAVVLQGHSDWIRSVEIATYTSDVVDENQHFREGDLMVASASQDKYIRIWKISKASDNTGKPAADDFNAQMMSALAEAGLDEGAMQLSTKAHLMEVQASSSKHTYSVMFDALLMAHDDWVHSVNWQPAILHLTRTLVASAKSYAQPMSLISASADKSIMIWRPDSASEAWVNQVRLGEVGGSTLGYYGARFSPDGQFVIANGYNGAINVWSQTSATEWSPRVALSGHTAPIKDLQWEPSGKFLVTTSLDQTTRLAAPWNRDGLSTWHEIARPQIHGYDLQCFAFVHGYGFVSGADEKIIRVFEAPQTFVQSLASLTKEAEDAEVIAKRPFGASVPALGLSNKAVFAGDIDKDATTHDVRNLSAYTAVASTPTSFLDTLQHPPFEQHLLQHTLWPEVNKLYGHGYEIVSVAASHNGRFVASACKAAKAEHASVRLWSTKTWKEVSLPLAGHNLTVTSIRFSPDDRYLLTVGRDRGWVLFQVTEDGQTYELYLTNPKAHARIIWDGAWTHDARIFATGSRDKTVKFWTFEATGKALKNVLTMKFDESVTALDFAPELIHNRNAHVATINSLVWRPRPHNIDSAGLPTLQLGSCSDDNSVRLFTVAFPAN
ncbi:Elongator subunit elp2 [Geranomyces variabilis]|uniref:Elongator complex protein 2 n=1 Tax=Geranomyces variabilis TaxID=109894 RepID=A0AAD5TKJ8_9FUNG|nr:Elongator subunit elp2 [Geranomyces variabilis]